MLGLSPLNLTGIDRVIIGIIQHIYGAADVECYEEVINTSPFILGYRGWHCLLADLAGIRKTAGEEGATHLGEEGLWSLRQKLRQQMGNSRNPPEERFTLVIYEQSPCLYLFPISYDVPSIRSLQNQTSQANKV